MKSEQLKLIGGANRLTIGRIIPYDLAASTCSVALNDSIFDFARQLPPYAQIGGFQSASRVVNCNDSNHLVR